MKINLLAYYILIVFITLSSFIFPQTNYSENQFNNPETVEWQEDLLYMAQEMPKIHNNLYHTTTEEQFHKSIDALYYKIPTLKRHQIIVEMEKIVASIGDGHTNIYPTRDKKIGFRRYPIKLYFFVEGLIVRSATDGEKNLIGSRVEKIGEFSVEEAYNSVSALIGQDNEMDAKYFAPFLLTIPEVINALGIVNDMENASFTFEKDGKLESVLLKPIDPVLLLASDTDISWKAEEGWIDARKSSINQTPLWLKDPENKFWFEYLPDSQTVYVQVNQIGDKTSQTIEEFSTLLFEFIEENPVDLLILDLRLNRGGNGTLNRSLIRALIKSNKIDQIGKSYTIIGRSTWSAAQFLCNDLERFSNTTFVGEPTGGKINHYGDSRKIILPNSGITVRVSTLWWQEDERDNRYWIAPQLAANLTFNEYRNNIDPALNAIFNYKPMKSLFELILDSAVVDSKFSARDVYKLWRSNPINEYLDVESELISAGYSLIENKKINCASEVFMLCAEIYPTSWNAYDSLAETYLTFGDTTNAIQYYNISLKLNPRNFNAIEILKILNTN